jgi:O-antigen/teichoic acid export membrane protein
MGIIKRQGLKSSIINYLGVLIGVIFFNFVFPNLISKEYLGLITLLQYLMYVIAPIATLGLGGILLHYYHIWKSQNSNKISYFNAFSVAAMLLCLGLIFLLLLLVKDRFVGYYQQQSPLFTQYYFIVFPLVAIATLSTYFEQYAMVNMRTALPSFLREILTRILLIICIYLFAVQVLDLDALVYALPLAYMLPFLFLLLYAIKTLRFKAVQPLAYVRKNKDLKAELFYGASLLMATILANLHNFLDGIILPAYLGLGALGIYMRPLVLGQMIQVPYRAIGSISSPIIRQSIVDEDFGKLHFLHKQISLNLFLIGAFLFTIVIVNTEGIFSLLPVEYSVAKSVLYIVGVGRLLDMAFGLNSEIIIYSKYYKRISFYYFITVAVAISLNVLLIPRWGMNGASIATSSSLILFNFMKTIFIYQKFRMHCFSKNYIPILLVSFCTIAIMHFIPLLHFVDKHRFFNSCLNISFVTTVSVLLFLVPTYFLKVSVDLNDFIRLVLNGKIFKGGHKMESL